ncbi:cell wall-binding repeat-containing protein [Peptacetobacter sp.]|uniref:cell wall-binding repeat-containing protein n=1 Tax=Peptacetobacter sp. TaxID=2991975 RepID=UPI003AB89865
MNKKKLSVVMAGAMLASSVAPVLAAEVTKTEMSASEAGLLIKKVRETLTSKVFADKADDKDKLNILADGTNLRGKSVYFVTVDGKKVALDNKSTQAQFQTTLGNLKAGQVVEIWSYGYEEKDGKYYASKESEPTYTTAELKALADDVSANSKWKPYMGTILGNETSAAGGVKFDSDTGILTITFGEAVHAEGVSDIVLTAGDKELNFAKYINVDGEEATPADSVGSVQVADFRGFPLANAEKVDIDSEKVETITVTPGGTSLSVEDLYDGLMLTTKGHDFLAEMKYYDKADRNDDLDVTVNTVKQVNAEKKWSFTVEFPKVGSLEKQTYTITGTDKNNIDRLNSWLTNRAAKVDILAGDNRYETAVEIAEEYAGLDVVTGSDSTNGNIVLVNGNSLVDGLAAAPLAESLNVNSRSKTPILLTESDKLPTATKDYLFRVLKNIELGNLENVKISIVGGTSVVSKSLERELEGYGFDVERFGGDNREETSLEVAEAVFSNNKSSKGNAYVVGAQGEADAMSIAPVAAGAETPIIVAKNGGLSEDAIDELKGFNVTVIGGENAVSAADFKALKAKANSIIRVAGENRQATNAAIINKYYTISNTSNVIVAKDGQNNKNELIDALAAANMASEKKAPIVLATNKLSTSQINALELKGKNAEALYQVGNGVARDVVKEIAQRLGLTN